MNKIVFFIFLTLLLVSCSLKTPIQPNATIEPTLSDLFKTQALKFIEEASKLSALTKSGVNYLDYKDQLVNVHSKFDTLDTLWTSNFLQENRASINKAIEGWDLAQSLWELKLNESKEPNEVFSKELFNLYKDYSGDLLVSEKYTNYTLIKDPNTGDNRFAL